MGALKKNYVWAIRLVEQNFHHPSYILEKMEWNTRFDKCQSMIWHGGHPSLKDVILFFKDPRKKLVRLVCSLKELDALAPTNARKGFEVNKIKDLNTKAVLKKCIKFKEFIELEREDTIRESRGCQHTTIMVESFATKQVVKWS